MKYAILLATALLAGCAVSQPASDGSYFLNGSRIYDKVIVDPFVWLSERYEDVTYEVVDGVERIMQQEAWGDLDHDGIPELFIGSGPSRNPGAAIFTPVRGGYRYIGSLDGRYFRILPKDENGRPQILVYVCMGGHDCFVKVYTHDGEKFICTSSEEMHCGDGAPEENNRRLDELFFSDSAKSACLKWKWHWH